MLSFLNKKVISRPLRSVRKVDSLLVAQVREMMGSANQQLILMVRGV